MVVAAVMVCAVATVDAVMTVTPAVLCVVVKSVPVASSLIVAVPAPPVVTLLIPPVLVAVRVIVSLLSIIVSIMIATRTNKLAASASVPSPSPGI